MLLRPIIFFLSNNNFWGLNTYKISPTDKIIKNFKLFKKFYFILFYSNVMLLDNKFCIDMFVNKKKTLKFLEKNKMYFLFFYYNKKIYNYNRLLKLIKYTTFLYMTFYQFLGINQLNLGLIKFFIFLKKKNANN
uniref:Uncharacterized protein n=1 Tax=Paramoeba aparasomata TaxID=2583407 RepID=A0A5P8HBJ3_9EUKA|nr:hypothetical protein [Paramoeba aparasomata]